ncbi:hypothetical protein C8N35_1169 [Breoghania corrubedonensis]|uniref:Uncharacterized protein n=1 Tax=Breoghania corrubedonensis TaxID=665038 RepID=A0A2T5UPW4_9HYPH|nr:hypothetical protein [Breoghania corrubedonensis]PTW53554.1 hypothetical protein C8N35_1169 [Breoghania corrubedonensis]
MPIFRFSVQYRSVRSITVRAADKDAAMTKASDRMENAGQEAIAFSLIDGPEDMSPATRGARA